MIEFKTGNLFDSNAEALVNTVNCEGYMGKGIAYQFKNRYPLMYADYQKKCRNGQLKIGLLHCFTESGKMIINFPTKDKWRAKSKIEYISQGLDALINLISIHKISSIAIPPLGSGNGGLAWNDVKKLIIEKLSPIEKNVVIEVYEPSNNIKPEVTSEPKLHFSALVLMKMKLLLDKSKFTDIGLQKTAYFFNFYYDHEYFKFKKEKFGPYDHSITIICKDIKAFQEYYGIDTLSAYNLLYSKLISDSIETKLEEIIPAIKKAAEFTNSISTLHDVEGIATALFIIQTNAVQNEEHIVQLFKAWSPDKAARFKSKEILHYIDVLYDKDFITKDIVGISLCKAI